MPRDVMTGQAALTTTPVPRHIAEVVAACAERFGAELRAVLWHGSRARGEAGPQSDEDLILLFVALDDGVLLGLRGLFLESGRKGWSVYTLSEAELTQLPPDRKIRFAHGFQVVHGAFEPLPIAREDIVAHLRWNAREVSYQCRDRLISKERVLPTMYRMAKICVFTMKARHLLEHGSYPLTRAALLPLVDDLDDRTIIDWVDRWDAVRSEFERDPVPLMLHLDAFARRIVGSLPEDGS